MSRSGGFSRARLGRMHDVMARTRRARRAGLVTLLSRRGEDHVDAIGTTSPAGADPIRRDTIFRIASMTKPIAAAAAMILVEECKPLRSASRWIGGSPSWPTARSFGASIGHSDGPRARKRPITVRDLLTHRMGFASSRSHRPNTVSCS